MCAVFGYLDYKGKVSNAILKNLIQNLSIAAEVRGTDATGISYVNHGKVVTFKKAKPAHKVKLFFPRNTKCVIGHTRMTTQGSEKYNYNNHPFDGRCVNLEYLLMLVLTLSPITLSIYSINSLEAFLSIALLLMVINSFLFSWINVL